MRHIPNFITSLNLVAGFISIVFAINGDLVTASWLILLAMVFDWFDGFAARMLGSYSAIGKELDSLADAISFGVAPPVIMYQLLGSSLSLTAPMIENIKGTGEMLVLLSPVIMCVSAIWRLAIFNTDESQVKSFKGLATPANALAVISIVIAVTYSNDSFFSRLTESTAFLVILTLILSLLMVSRIPLLSLKISHLKIRGNEGRYLLIILVVVSMALLGIGAATLIIPLYILASLVSPLFKK